MAETVTAICAILYILLMPDYTCFQCTDSQLTEKWFPNKSIPLAHMHQSIGKEIYINIYVWLERRRSDWILVMVLYTEKKNISSVALQEDFKPSV